jgi:hypothetical protein
MTRKEQTDIILKNIGGQLADKPDAAEAVGQAFSAWFRQMVMAGAQLMQPQQQPQEGGQDGGGAEVA